MGFNIEMTWNSFNSFLLFTFSSIGIIQLQNYLLSNFYNKKYINDDAVAYLKLIGNTPLIKLTKLSEILGYEVYVKMECLNPGGTGKDRAARRMIYEAMKKDNFYDGCPIVEGTSGSTGIALAIICKTLGLKLHVVLPDDQSIEKVKLLQTYGAITIITPAYSISNPEHYVNKARKISVDLNGIFIDQFENLANFQVHLEETGPEIWKQCPHPIDMFVMSSGTGGTIAGVSQFLKAKNKNIKVILADPNGSSLHNKVKFNVCYTTQQSERRVKKHRYDSIVEGVGLDRITNNFKQAIIDDSYQISDQHIVTTAHWLLQNEGLFVGSSSALNIATLIKACKSIKKGSTIVTVICDNGSRHLSRLWNEDYLMKHDLHFPTNSEVSTLIDVLQHDN